VTSEGSDASRVLRGASTGRVELAAARCLEVLQSGGQQVDTPLTAAGPVCRVIAPGGQQVDTPLTAGPVCRVIASEFLAAGPIAEL
jgi:hypothetical protein